MNSNFQPYNCSPKTSGRGLWDKDQHQQSNLHVKGKDERRKIEDSIKQKEDPKGKGSEN